MPLQCGIRGRRQGILGRYLGVHGAAVAELPLALLKLVPENADQLGKENVLGSFLIPNKKVGCQWIHGHFRQTAPRVRSWDWHWMHPFLGGRGMVIQISHMG